MMDWLAQGIGKTFVTHYNVGSPKLFSSMKDISEIASKIKDLQNQGKTAILVGNKEAVLGIIAISDPVRGESLNTVKLLHTMGFKVVMLTGDNLITAKAIASQVGIDEVHADLSPEDKTMIISKLSKLGKVIMVGDGVNDAPALAAADVGIAMGAAGTDVALETADVALMGDDLSKLSYILNLSKRSWKIILQNICLSIIVIMVLVIGAVMGKFVLPMAVLAHEISEFLVIASGLRMLKK